MSTDRTDDADHRREVAPDPTPSADPGSKWLESLAAEIADAVDVDWGTRAKDGPRGGTLRGLETIARIAEGYRSLGASHEPPKFRWGPLDVYERVGEGAFGEVYRAWDPRLALEVALKLRRDGGEVGSARELLEEARGLARVSHPNIVTVRGVDVFDGRFGLWADFVRGPTLEERLASRGRLPFDVVLRVGAALSRAIHAVHQAGFLHGDITSRNVMLADGARPVLVDFGATTPLGDDGISTSDIAGLTGTPVYCAPELFFGARPSVASDVYALGALVFRLLAHEHVVDGSSVETIRRELRRGRARSLRSIRSDVPGPLVRTVERAIASRPEDRFESAESFAAALETSAIPDNNLPRARTPFIGRSTEIEALDPLVVSGALITLVGAGGTGKTRLAREAATRLLGRFPDGVWFVDLAEVAAGRVGSKVARVLGVADRSTRSVEELLADHLAQRRTLLLLDNCEHVLDDVSRLADAVLERVGNVALLATSRERIGVEGERVFDVEPLPVPADAAEEDVERLAQVPSAALFLDRAHAVDAGFTLDGETATAVASICRRLDGIPLAIELAAAQVRTMSVAELARRMGEQLDLLVSRRRGGAARHRTLRDLLDWSHGSLGEAEQKLLAALSVFCGGWTIAHAVAVTRDDEVAERELVDAHRTLVERSLVVVVDVQDDETRYRLLEPVREYAAERLGVGSPVPRRFVRHMLETVWGDGVAATDQYTDAHRSLLAREFVNASAAFDEALARDDVTSAATLARALYAEWLLRGMYAEALSRHEIIWQRRNEIESPDLRGWIWVNAANIAGNMNRRDDNERYARAMLDEVDRGASAVFRVTGLSQLGTVAQSRGEFERCENHYEKALEAAAELGLDHRRATAMANLGIMVCWRGDLDRAQTLFESAEKIFRARGLIDRAAAAVSTLAETAFYAGRQEEARKRATDAVRELRIQGEPYNLVISLTLLARIYFVDDHLETSEAYGSEARAIARRAGLPQTYVLYILSAIAEFRGDHELAAELAVEALRFAHHKPGDVRSVLGLLCLPEGARERHASFVWMYACHTSLRNPLSGELDPVGHRIEQRMEELGRRAREALGDEVFDVAWSEGSTLGFEEAARRIFAAFPAPS